MKRILAPCTALALLLGGLVVALPEPADAQGSGGGRIYNPKRLRTRAEAPARGRILKDPRKAPESPRQPARRRAIIPNPEPNARGGSGYVKRGNMYYEKPAQIRVGGNPKRRVERVTIPHPNAKGR